MLLPSRGGGGMLSIGDKGDPAPNASALGAAALPGAGESLIELDALGPLAPPAAASRTSLRFTRLPST
jgi:hypothetical protein